MSRTAISLKFKMCLFFEEASYWAEKLLTDINLPPLMPDADNNFGNSLGLDFRNWGRHVQPKNRGHRCHQKAKGTHSNHKTIYFLSNSNFKWHGFPFTYIPRPALKNQASNMTYLLWGRMHFAPGRCPICRLAILSLETTNSWRCKESMQLKIKNFTRILLWRVFIHSFYQQPYLP